jgi:hypothetical protein
MKKFWNERSLAIALMLMFLSSWAVQAWTGWLEFKASQSDRQQATELFGSHGYVWSFLQATMENWQSEFLQLLTFVVLTAFLVYKGSPESKDRDEDIKAALGRIELRLDGVEGRTRPIADSGPSTDKLGDFRGR